MKKKKLTKQIRDRIQVIYTNHHMINKFEMWSMRKAIGLNYK